MAEIEYMKQVAKRLHVNPPKVLRDAVNAQIEAILAAQAKAGGASCK